MKKTALNKFSDELKAIREAGTYKEERIITTPQKARIDTTKAKGVLNMCANNYLGLSDNKELKSFEYSTKSLLSEYLQTYRKSSRSDVFI